MNKEELLQHLLNTLSPDNALRSSSERSLVEALSKAGVLADCLEIATEQSLPSHIRLVAITFVKNRIRNSWFISDRSPEQLLAHRIKPEEKERIKYQLIPAILSCTGNQAVLKQLTSSMEHILRLESTWDTELLESAHKMLNEHSDNFDYVYASLLLIHQVSKYHRFDAIENRTFMNTLVARFFPALETLLESYIGQISANTQVAQLIYLVLKIYKYSTYTEMPNYFTNDLNLLSKWCGYMFKIIDLESSSLRDLNAVELSSHPLSKCQKWSFANLHRLRSRHCTNENNQALQQNLITHFLPSILQHYWSVIDRWTQLKSEHWLSEVCLYHLVAFISECLQYDGTWGSIKEQLDPLIRHVIVPMLSASEETVELFEDDPQEYLRRFYDINHDSKTADVAANEFVYALTYRRFEESVVVVMNILNEIFQSRQQNMADEQIAHKTEAGLRLLSNVWMKLNKPSSPMRDQLDEITKSFILPQLSDSKYKWLQTRACETIALTTHNYKDIQLLSSVFQNVMNCFAKTSPLPLRIEAADALRYMVSYEPIANEVSPRISLVMSELLEMSNNFEFELINEIMDDIVSKFAKDLEPFATQLASNLNTQFLRIAEELLRLQNVDSDKQSSEETDKEYQAASILNTLTTMITTMTSQKEITFGLMKTIEPAIRFVLDNGLAIFLTEIMDLLESINYTLKVIIPESWSIFECVMDSFENYGFEYYDNYEPYFETICIHGFRNSEIANDMHLQQFLTAILTLLETDDYESDIGLVEFVYNLLSTVILSVGPNIEPVLPQILQSVLQTAAKMQADPNDDEIFQDTLKPFLKIFISCCFVRPVQTSQLIGQQFMKLIELWFNNENRLSTVFDLKLQILALISLLTADTGILSNYSDVILHRLIGCFEKLPAAIEKRVILMKRDMAITQLVETGEYDGEIFGEHDDDEELDQLTKDSPLDSINVVNEFKSFVSGEQQRLKDLLPPEKLQFVHDLISK
ncbi:hypothetical protein KL937_003373 [Ogataea polymorpha]|uniref:uncharacterized protein n=1 Tax=Ogataea polymorpha TaxID=460523 RepID=UPI0007F49930|nr:uncharacterized protein OGAPODRAFT_95700 [Ogataea polymorpha]KAG7878960.1 hypothetical protein KL937_003373 [Ogataea polymorpha]KAG7934220.1 hypothetical protein KL904_003554 [Ogataea polymorpha]OBA13534.1 hypothetical protein OGAPODRAFT_95700 [Ogataea polymorpha]